MEPTNWWKPLFFRIVVLYAYLMGCFRSPDSRSEICAYGRLDSDRHRFVPFYHGTCLSGYSSEHNIIRLKWPIPYAPAPMKAFCRSLFSIIRRLPVRLCAHIYSVISNKSLRLEIFSLYLFGLCRVLQCSVCVSVFFFLAIFWRINTHTHKESGEVSLEIENVVIAFPLETSLTVFMCGYTHRDIHAELQTDTQKEDSQKQI